MIRDFIKQYPALTAFGLILLAYLLYLPTTTYNYLPWDSGGYWRNGELFFKNGGFSLVNFQHDFRGYLLPLLYLPFNLFWKATGIELFAIVKILGAGLAATIFGIIAPKLWEVFCPPARIGLAPRLLFAFLGFAFWRDYFSFTLSDFPAMLVFMGCLLLLAQKPRWWTYLLAGVFYGAVMNFRPPYLICVPIIVMTIVVTGNRNEPLRRILQFLYFIAGVLLISAPQIAINARYHQSLSPVVLNKYGNKDKNLYLQQLEWGLQVQRFETNLDPQYPSPQLIFLDPAGKALAEELALDIALKPDPETKTIDFANFAPGSGLQSFDHFFRLVFSHPLVFSQLYLKHLFNGLDLQFPTPYIQNVFAVHYGLILLNYSVLFAALLIFGFRVIPKLNLKRSLFLLLFLAPGFLAIPTAIEPRYVLSFHMLAYALVAFYFPWHWVRRSGLKPKLLVGSLYLIFMLGCFLLSAQVQQSLMLQPRHLF